MPNIKASASIVVMACTFLSGTTGVCAEEKKTGETHKTENGKGITVEDLARGLKSAEQNIEKEIPKIGSAIGSAVKKLTEKESDKPASQKESPQQKQ